METIETKLEMLFNNPVLLYGLGVVGRAAIIDLKNLDVNIAGIAVTSAENVLEEYKGIKVCAIDNWKECCNKSILVLIITSEGYFREIQATLNDRGFHNIIFFDSALRTEVGKLSMKKMLEKHDISIQSNVLSIGNGNYINPFKTETPNSAGLLQQLADYVIPPLFNDYSLVDEGLYEYNDVKLNKDDVVLDLGANMGSFSVYAVSKGCIPYAFEPTPESIEIVKKHSELNGGRINIEPYAVADKCGETALYLNSYSSGGNSIALGGGSKSNCIMVKTITVDEFVDLARLERVDFIKADIEGAERLMLQGAQDTLKKYAPKLALCTYHLPDDKEVLTDLILKANPNYKIEYKWDKLFAHI